MIVFGEIVPLWLLFLLGIVIVVFLWKFIKFAIQLLLVIVVFFIILIALDYLNVFDAVQNLFSTVV